MKQHAADRQFTLRPGVILAALLAAFALALSGCGQLQDGEPDTLSVNFQFAGGGGAAPMATSTTQGISGPVNGDPVLSVVIGAIVISNASGSNPDGSFNPTDAANMTTANRDALEKDVEQSLQYLEIVPIPYPADFVSFPLPPDNAGTWQLVAVGLRHAISTLDEVQSDSPIYYGFSSGFLNGLVSPGGTAPTIQLQPWCGSDGNPSPPAPTGTPPC